MSKNKKVNPTRDFDAVQSQEHHWIALRRKQVQEAGYGTPKEDSAGLGLSGGGIRSAVFNLGLLQALERHGVMPQVDYLSTVSGGGYIGACYTWLKDLFPKASPFGTSRHDFTGQAGETLAWLRSHGKYLTAGQGLSAWSLTAAVFTATAANLLVIIPVMLLLFYLLTRQIPLLLFIAPYIKPLMDLTPGGDDGFAFIFALGVACLAVFLFLAVIYMSTTALAMCREYLWQRKMRGLQGSMLMFGVFFVVVGTIPLFHQYVMTFEKHLTQEFTKSETPSFVYYLFSRLSGSTIFVTIATGVLSLLAGRRKHGKEGAAPSKGRPLLVNIGLSLLIYGMFLLFYELMKEPNDVSLSPSLGDSPWFWYTLMFSAYLAIFSNVNMVSMHRYYRNRLMETFMPVLRSVEASSPCPKPDRFCIYKETPNSDAPFHIVNAAVNMVGSANTKRQGRGADNFIFSPLFCGAEATGYLQSNLYIGNTMDMATAIAISGAAVNPNSVATRSRPLSFLMTLLNLRLGYWIRNPRYSSSLLYRGLLARPWWYIYMLSEMFGDGLNERNYHVHLADGGHFENLALYELVRRRCRYIIISDAGADPAFDFGDLAKVIEMVRVDFGAKVSLNIDDLVPQGEQRLSKRAFALGSIDYIDGKEPAKLIYIKTAITEGLPEDIYGYRRAHPTYPDQSTANQFFVEAQFEAYRELGFQIGKALCAGENHADMEALFRSVGARVKE